MQTLSDSNDPATSAAIDQIVRLAVDEVTRKMGLDARLTDEDRADITLRMKQKLGELEARKLPPAPVSEVGFDRVLLALSIGAHRAAIESQMLGLPVAGR